MKVGVLTIHDCDNFGANLQASATIHLLKELGYDAELIDYATPDLIESKQILRMPTSKRAIIDDIRALLMLKQVRQRRKHFDDYREKYYRRNGFPIRTMQELKNCVESYDSIIVGSDQTFNLHLMGDPEYRRPYFLPFTDKKKISFASSMGEGIGQLTTEEEDFIRESLLRFDYLSVRDKPSADFLQRLTKRELEIIADPTLDVSIDYWKKIERAASHKKEKLQGDYIFFYSVLSAPWVVQKVESIAKKMNMKVVAVHLPNMFEMKSSFLRKCDIGPAEFLSLINNAKLVLTTSFHATVFSLLFNKDFYTFRLGEGNRIGSLLQEMNITERFLEEKTDIHSLSLSSPIDFRLVNERIEKKREVARAFLINALGKNTAFEEKLRSDIHSNKQTDKICEEEYCTGCLACQNICPRNAIRVKDSIRYGYLPIIDHSKCIGCGACSRVCQVLHPIEGHRVLATYAAWARDVEVLEKGSSGGIAQVISRYFLGRNGVVYGVAFTNDNCLKHIRVDYNNKEDLDKLYGSKYVQSYTADIFRCVNKDLLDGKRVLFFGTGCQIAGLRKYLEKEYSELYLVDIICHGTPAATIFRNHLESISKGKVISDIRFREGKDLRLVLSTDNKKYYNKPFYNDPYYLGFELGLTQKESCYQCPYACTSRQGDITLGDFHGLGETVPTDYQTENGSSLLLVNTEKGKILFSSVNQSLIDSENHSIFEAVSNNPQLSKPIGKNNNREGFLSSYNDIGANRALFEFMKKDMARYTVINKIMRIKVFKKMYNRVK